MKTKFISFCFIVLGVLAMHSQDMLVSTRLSQRASITQRIGTTDVTVVYHSPLAKKRKIFGGIVPYDFVVDGVEYPWRAGSNNNTTIEFTHDVKIQGKPLAKGIYSLHIFVKENEWTYIFSNKTDGWGSFYYEKKDDALRVTAVPEDCPYQEWLAYEFVNREPESARLELRWSTKKCGIDISVDVDANVLADLEAKEEKKVDDYVKMAQRSLAIDASNYDKAIAYLDKSLELKEEFRGLLLKSDILAKKGDKKSSEVFRKKAMEVGEGFPYYYYYPLSLLLLEGKNDATFQILSEMVEKEPNNWIPHLAMGEYYIKMGNQKKATQFFKKAYENAPEISQPYARYMYLSNQLILDGS